MATTNCLTNLNQLAENLGVMVRTAPTPAAHWGVYDHSYRLITLRPGLGPIQYRSTLAHELGHAHYGDTGHLQKNEHRADSWAAKALLDIDVVAEAIRITRDTTELAAELEVLPWVLHAFVDTLGRRDVSYLLRTVRACA